MVSPSFMKPYSDISARQEAFSRSYIRAVVSIAGCAVASPETDNDKVDLTVSSRVKGTKFTKPKIDIQAKCRLGDLSLTDPISYKLDMDTYDSLRDPMVANPRILVVVLVPELAELWAIQDETQLALRHCGYWLSLRGLDEVTGQETKTIHIPRANVFTPHTLQAMMVHASNGADFALGLDIGAVLL